MCFDYKAWKSRLSVLISNDPELRTKKSIIINMPFWRHYTDHDPENALKLFKKQELHRKLCGL